MTFALSRHPRISAAHEQRSEEGFTLHKRKLDVHSRAGRKKTSDIDELLAGVHALLRRTAKRRCAIAHAHPHPPPRARKVGRKRKSRSRAHVSGLRTARFFSVLL
jgi:hypothetical protein